MPINTYEAIEPDIQFQQRSHVYYDAYNISIHWNLKIHEAFQFNILTQFYNFTYRYIWGVLPEKKSSLCTTAYMYITSKT